MNHNWRKSRALIAVVLLAVIGGLTFVTNQTDASAQDVAPIPPPQPFATEQRIFAGDQDCGMALGGALTEEAAAASLPVTVCVFATNIGPGPAFDYFVSSPFLGGEGEFFAGVERGETVVLRRFVTELPGGQPEVSTVVVALEGDVECSRGGQAIVDPRFPAATTTYCFEITNLGAATAQDVVFVNAEFDLEVEIGALAPGETFVVRHVVELRSTSFLADLRDSFNDSDGFEIEVFALVEAGIITRDAYDSWLQEGDIYQLAGQPVDAEIEVDIALQRFKWDVLGINDYEFEYRDNCFCFWPDEVAPPWRVRVIDGAVESAVSISGGGAVDGVTLTDIFDRVQDAADSDPFLLEASFEIAYGYPTNWYVDRDPRIADEEFGQTVLSFTPLRNCNPSFIPVDEPCQGGAQVQIVRQVLGGDVPCPVPIEDGGPDWYLDNVTVCYTITNVGDEVATDVQLTDADYDLAVVLGDLQPGASIDYRHVVDRSVRRILADLRGELLTLEQLNGEVDQLLGSRAITPLAYDEYLAITDFYDLAGQDPESEIEVDLDRQLRKWDALGIDNYEFVYRDSCFCFWEPGTEPPWQVRVVDGQVESAVSVAGGGTVRGTTITAMLDGIVEADERDPIRLEGSFDIVYGYPTSWFVDVARLIADEEFGQRIESFVPLRECVDGLIPFDQPCEGVISDVEVYPGEVDCATPGVPPLPENVLILETIVTLCLAATNLGDELATDVVVVVDNPPFVAEVGDIAPGATVNARFVVDRSIRDYALDAVQPGDAERIDRTLSQLVDTGTISAADRAAWTEFASIDEPRGGPEVFVNQVAKWNALGLDDYEFTYQQFCFCPSEVTDPMLVRVVAGEVVSATSLATGEPTDALGRPQTIDAVLDRISPDSNAFSITASFERLYGFPTSFAVDQIELAVDDEFSGSVFDFVPLVDCNGELVAVGSPCVAPPEPDCSRLVGGGGHGYYAPADWRRCWREIILAWLAQLDRQWANAWGVHPV